MSLTDKIFEAGVVGCGGAGFPTNAKLNAKAEVFIVNGAECEPLLHTDRYLMEYEPEKIIAGIDLIRRELGLDEAYIATKCTYEPEIAALRAEIERTASPIKIHTLESFYPAGDEQVIVYEVTGKVVPPSGIPLDVGVIVDNVATVAAVADAAKGIPFTDKYLTVTGEVKEPSILRVPVGISFEECIDLAGGLKRDDVILISGGPMMGIRFSWENGKDEVVKKTTSGIVALPKDGDYDVRHRVDIRHMLNRARSACIQCTYCTQMCPRHMLGHPIEPHRIMRKMSLCTNTDEILDDKDVRQAAICSECGVCETYACPMGLQPRTINALLKGELSSAGIRYERDRDIYEPDPNREYRKVPTRRIAARAGVGRYYNIDRFAFKQASAREVRLPLKMNIGAPSVPVIADGARVDKGELIAACPEGKLGANLHASISGTAHVTDESITITEV